MIKLVYCVRKRGDVSDKKFHEYWLNNHGPLVTSVRDDIAARKYIQSHTIDTPLHDEFRAGRGLGPWYEGITEVWYDGLDTLQDVLGDEARQAAAQKLLEDEATFIDFSDSAVFMTEEHTIFDYVNGETGGKNEGMVKLVYCIRKRDDISDDEYHRYWLENHGPLVKSFAEAIHAKKYVQSHTVKTPVNDALIESRGLKPWYEGITEVWWDSLDDMQAGMGSGEGEKAARALAEDEAKFIDFAHSSVFMTREHTIFD